LFKKLLFQIEYGFSFLKRNLLFVILGLGISVAVFFFRNQLSTLSKLPMFNVQIIGIQGRFQLDSLPEEVSQKITFGLTESNQNQKQEISPIVDSLNVENDNKTYVFTLKNDVFWHNGKNLTSNDINYQINGLDFEAIDKYKLRVSTQAEFSPILSLLQKPLFKNNLIGLGPYQVKKIQYQYNYIKSITLKSQNQPLLIYRFYPNQDELITAFKLGEVDKIESNFLPQEFSTQKNIKISQSILVDHQYSAIFFNTKKLSNKQFRQSLAYATPKTNDKNERCLGPISPNSWAYNPAIKQYNYDPTRAQELLEESGEQISSLNLTVVNRDLLAQAEEIKNAWNKVLNINVTVTVENQIDQENFDAVLAFGSIPKDPDQYIYWHSTQTKTNPTNFQDERIDKLLEEGRLIFDNLKRKDIYYDFQRYLLEESPAIFLNFPTLYTVSRLK
jgi:peptide/nickel transport system substrate-binding protein